VRGRCSHLLRHLSRLAKTVAVAMISQCTSVCTRAHILIPTPFKLIRATTWYIRVLCASLILSQPALAAVEDNTILALEPLEGLVVVQTAAGELEVIAIGDAFPDSEVIVKQVLADKVLAEEVIGGDKKITRQVWIYKAEKEDAGSRVERLLLSVPQNGILVPDTINLQPMTPDAQVGIQ
jgi:hypothetical protein